MNNVELSEVKRLERIIADIAKFKSDTLCDIPEEWPIVRDIYHGRMTAEEAIRNSHP